jgi:hypothetical protein
MKELTPELQSFRKLNKIGAFLMTPGIFMLLYTSIANPINGNFYIAYALLAPGAILILYLLLFKRNLAAQNAEYQKQIRLNVDPKLRSKRYRQSLFLFPILGFGAFTYGEFTNYIIPNYYFIGLVVCLIWFVFGFIALSIADLAVSKGRSWIAFFWLSLLISPLVTWLILASIKDDKGQAPLTTSNGKLSEELLNLEKLYKSGAINDEEYTKAKAKIIG